MSKNNTSHDNVEQYLSVISITPVAGEYAAAALHMDYAFWCRQNKMEYLCTRDFASSLQSLGWTRRKRESGNYWVPPETAAEDATSPILGCPLLI